MTDTPDNGKRGLSLTFRYDDDAFHAAWLEFSKEVRLPSDPVEFWREAVRLALAGEPHHLISGLTKTYVEWEVDAAGRPVDRDRFRQLPDDAALRAEIVDALCTWARSGKGQRGRPKKIDANALALLRLLIANRASSAEAVAEFARFSGVSAKTVQNALDEAGPYDKAREEGKEARRLKRAAKKK